MKDRRKTNGMIQTDLTVCVFPSELGWIGLAMHRQIPMRLVFGYRSAGEAVVAVGSADVNDVDNGRGLPLVDRLQAYAEGMQDDFSDVAVELGQLTPFQAKVYRHCRQIPNGQTLTYGQLAQRAGSPRAARAVGNVMARNPLPLIVPCHRVVTGSGQVGRYSAGEGKRTKLRLLELEASRGDFSASDVDSRQHATA